MKNIAVFASGNGSNFKEIYKHTIDGNILGKIVLLISNNPSSGAVKVANENNINCKIINSYRFNNFLDQEYEIALNKFEIDLILLAGFMKKIPHNIVEIYKNKILNIHPSLLPKYGGEGFYGMNVHEAVIKSGDNYSGATVHYVNEEYDKGSIAIQKKVKVNLNDTAESLAKKVLVVEHKIYPKAVKLFCEDEL